MKKQPHTHTHTHAHTHTYTFCYIHWLIRSVGRSLGRSFMRWQNSNVDERVMLRVVSTWVCVLTSQWPGPVCSLHNDTHTHIVSLCAHFNITTVCVLTACYMTRSVCSLQHDPGLCAHFSMTKVCVPRQLTWQVSEYSLPQHDLGLCTHFNMTRVCVLTSKCPWSVCSPQHYPSMCAHFNMTGSMYSHQHDKGLCAHLSMTWVCS